MKTDNKKHVSMILNVPVVDTLNSYVLAKVEKNFPLESIVGVIMG